MVRIRVDGIGVGSGFLAEGNYIVTAAHVVWPYTAESDIVFENGTEYANVPVVSLDHLADLAFLGPIDDTSAPPVDFTNVEDESEGDVVLVIGYASDSVGLTVTNGEFEYIWHWRHDAAIFKHIDVVYFYGARVGGMSGGPLTNDRR